MTIKIIVWACSLVSAVLVAWFFFWVAVRNTGSEQIVVPTLQITAAILAGVVFFSINTFSKNDTSSYSSDIHAVFHEQGEILDFTDDLQLVGSKFGRGYSYLHHSSLVVASSMGPVQHSPNNGWFGDRALLIGQVSFMEWLIRRCTEHWDVTVDDWFRAGRAHYRTEKNSGAEAEPEKIDTLSSFVMLSEQLATFEDVTSLDKQKARSMFLREEFFLPSGSALKIDGATIVISSDEYELKIKIVPITHGPGGLDLTRLGQRIAANTKEPGEWGTVDYRVDIDATFFRWTKLSPKTMAIKRWITQLTTDFERDFSYKNVQPALEDSFATMKSNWIMVTPSTGYKKAP